jgi:hypothetical protein
MAVTKGNRRKLPPGRLRLAVVYGGISFLVTVFSTYYVEIGLANSAVRVDFLNDLIVVDGVIFGFFSITAARDFEKKVDRSQLNADLVVTFLLLFSLFGSILAVAYSTGPLDVTLLGDLFASMMYGTLLIVMRLVIVTIETKAASGPGTSSG